MCVRYMSEFAVLSPIMLIVARKLTFCSSSYKQPNKQNRLLWSSVWHFDISTFYMYIYQQRLLAFICRFYIPQWIGNLRQQKCSTSSLCIDILLKLDANDSTLWQTGWLQFLLRQFPYLCSNILSLYLEVDSIYTGMFDKLSVLIWGSLLTQFDVAGISTVLFTGSVLQILRSL
jgi:hypothetical protein